MKTTYRVCLSAFANSQNNNIINNFSHIVSVLQILANLKFHWWSNWRIWFLDFGLGELILVEIGKHNGVCEEGIRKLDVLKGGVLILIKSYFWTSFEVGGFSLSFSGSCWILIQAGSSGTTRIFEDEKRTLEVLGGVVLSRSSFCGFLGWINSM